MPEGHTIHRLAERHRALFGGQVVAASSPQGRFADGAARFSGRELVDTEAYGKHLLHHYAVPNGRARPPQTPLRPSPAGGVVLHVHLGLYGKFSDGPAPAPLPIGEVRLRLLSADHWLDLRGPAACELLDPPDLAALLARLGPDPLRDDADPSGAYAAISRSERPLMALLMDQSIVAGAGLIYVTEALFRAGLPPTAPGKQLRPEQWEAIWADLRALMRVGVAEGRIDTVHSVHLPEAMGRPPRVDRHGGEVYVYRRAGQPCLVCGTEVRTAVLNARNAYWCTKCQR